MILFADVGIPMLAVVWPVAWLAFLPVVLVESLVALQGLELRFRRALVVTAAANAVSTLVGIPIVWFIMVIIQMTMTGGGSLWHASDSPTQAVIAACRRAAWLGPYEQLWMVPLAAIFLCIPFYFASVLIEYLVVRCMVTNGPSEVRRFCWRANLWSYMAIVVFWACCLLTSVYGGGSSSVPRVTSEEARVIAEIERLGGRVDAYGGSRDRSGITVSLNGSRMTDADLERVQPLALRVESLYMTAKTTDAGLEHIKRLTQLQELSLDETKVTDAGLKHLKELTKLQSLDLRKTKVSVEGVKDLQQALPNCKIER